MRRTEVQGRRGDRETGKGAGASARGASAGPGCLPVGARPRPSARPLPHLPIPPPRRVRGNTLLGDFWYPSKCGSLCIPRTLASTRDQSLQSRRPLHQMRPPEHGRHEDPHRASAVPQPGTRLSGDLDPVGRAPEGTERTIYAQRGGTPREIWSHEALPLKWEPHSQLTRLGVPRRRCSGVRSRERGRGGERRREIRREGGKQRRRKGGT